MNLIADMEKVKNASQYINPATYINQTSGNQEYFTPPYVIEAARATMGGIDLDPASCAKANEIVRADKFFTKEDNGLSHQWAGNVWMNHPFGDEEKACKSKCKKKRCKIRGFCITEDIPGNSAWVSKLVRSYEVGGVTQACCIVFASTSEAWFQVFRPYWICYLSPRVNYLDEQGNVVKGVSKGSCVVYMGGEWRKFVQNFSPLGDVRPSLQHFVI